MTQFIEPSTHDEDARTIDGTVIIMGCDVALTFEYEYSHKNEDYRIVSAYEMGKPQIEIYQLVGMFSDSNNMFAPIEEEIKQMIETVEEEGDFDSNELEQGHMGAGL